MKTSAAPCQESSMRAHYADTALARMGIPFEQAMQIAAIRRVVEAAARGDAGR